MKIYVGGSLSNVPRYPDLCSTFIEMLGERIIKRQHTLLTGCSGSLDKAIAKAAHSKIKQSSKSKSDRERLRHQLVSYLIKHDQETQKEFGFELTQSMLEDWEFTHPFLVPPEQIENADVTIFVAGSEGTFLAANWARIAQKPILGIAQFGGAGQQIFVREKNKFGERYGHLVKEQDFDLLRQVTTDPDRLAKDVLRLCEDILVPKNVFTIMSFKPKYESVFSSYKKVCKRFNFKAVRTDKTRSGDRIVPEILKGIRNASFVIADVTEASMNVFYEIGYAEGLGRPVIVTAKEGTKLPFDFADIPVEFWSSPKDLCQKLERRVKETDKCIRKRRNYS